MERTLEILGIVIAFPLLAFIVCMLWQTKSKNSLPSLVAHMVVVAILFALEVWTLILEVALNRSYSLTVALIFLLALNATVYAYRIREVSKEHANNHDVEVKDVNDEKD